MARSLFAPDTSKDFEKLAPDSYPCRLYSFIDLGTQPVKIKEWGKEEIKKIWKIRLGFEFPTELREDGKPFTISRDFTFSLHKKSSLLPIVESMIWQKIEDTKTFDILSLVEKAYFATCIESADGKYINIQNIVKLPKTMACPEQVNKTQIVLQEDWEKEWDNLPEFIRNKIAESDEYNNPVGDVQDVIG